MDNIIITNSTNTFSELLIDYDLGSFKYEREQNAIRSISLTAFKTRFAPDIYDLIQNESILLFRGQQFVIKTIDPKSNNVTLTNDITAHHIMYEFQNHYIDKDLENEEMNNDSDEELPTPTWTLEQYLDFCFKGNKLGYSYKIVGKFEQRIAIDEVGDKNGIEFLVEGAELFGYIFHADNKTIYIYDEESYYRMSEVELIGGYNVDEASVSVNTQEQKTYIKGYGKKKTKTETKNYNPIKPPNLTYVGTFIKEGTWYTETINNSYTKQFNCKWGNETLTFTLKKGSLGGMVRAYLDNEEIGRYNTYSKTVTSEQIIISKNLTKGNHTFKLVFTGTSSGVDYKNKKPRMYVGTEKSTVLNLTAVLKGEDIYHVSAEYYSPYYDKNNPKQAATIYDDNILDKAELIKRLKQELNDEPVVELSTNYLDTEQITERDLVYFKHTGLGFDTMLKVIKITESHPLLNLPVEVDFSNKKTDIIKIQQEINRRTKNLDKQIKSGTLGGSAFVMPKIASDSFGSVLINE
ncbi:prophage endopeptidase tail family protein [Mammaliicoccus fleurettii]|uniref:prophage endopeptidase tail family protein n=1 Tax=Mammaliicoccus fleurettii TaxID=150056 RepID=UPI001AAC5442|nr:prophage endopeptidase tail family protein [Mammaliicoccus fleurettii]MBO3062713.1 phage tail protein [Mammaliicoccus fleurettii]